MKRRHAWCRIHWRRHTNHAQAHCVLGRCPRRKGHGCTLPPHNSLVRELAKVLEVK